ncbi:unnamed protein product [Brassica rapa]|uniref:BED-type domain-containing protein n=1 Tax=Brassica campestris TaxID=3711 RepID=A0A3P6AWJ9_BRACM|nr:unnamed protein product [Brassica rapa]VDC97002.1 unnamed protein product [Brassica rapa]
MAGSSANSHMNQEGTSETPALKRNSKDVAWEYGMLCNPSNPDKVKCKLCGKLFSGGAFRIKEHIAKIPGNVSACPLSTKDDQEKCKNAIDEAKKKKKNKRSSDADLRNSVKICDVGDEDDEAGAELEELRSKKIPRTLGPMDKFASDINPRLSSVETRQQNISDALCKDRLHKVHQYIGRWVFASGVPFHATANDEFKLMLEAVGQFGSGVTPPSQYLLREPLLKEEVERVKGLLKAQEEERKENGCSVLTDAWSDRKRRSIMNLCINCRGGTMFLSSKDCSEEAHTGEFIYEYVKGCIEDVGVENVVQVVTDNAPNNMAAARFLKEKMPDIFWTSCAAHTVNLMLESIAKLQSFKTIIKRAKGFTIFVYAHHKTLAMMRKFTDNKDIVRPGVTRFASCFLTLQSLMEKTDQLQSMFVSAEWKQCKWAKHSKGVEAFKTMTSMQFWNGVTMCLKVFGPLVKVLRLVDGDMKPTMGYLHGELLQAKKDICAGLNNVQRNIQLIMTIIDQRIEGRLDSPFHLTGYFLNPYYLYKDQTIPLHNNVLTSFFKCVNAFIPDDLSKQCNVINSEINKYKNKEDNFGTPWAVKGCEEFKDDYDPVEWWNTYGTSVPNLQRMAKRILSLTTSSSGCERAWSSFEGEKNIDILLADDATHAQEWLVEGDDGEHESAMGVGAGDTEGAADDDDMADIRELRDEDFISDAEEEDFAGTNLESDEDQVPNMYGEEEYDN